MELRNKKLTYDRNAMLNDVKHYKEFACNGNLPKFVANIGRDYDSKSVSLASQAEWKMLNQLMDML
jgi:hypothetical protein